MDFEEAKQILRALELEGVRYVLVGSMAMAAQGLVRATREMDFFVAPDPENVENLRRALRSVFGADPNLEQITAEDLGGEYPAIEYVPPESAYSLDILSRLGEVFRYEQMEAEDLVVDDIHVRVATPRMLYRMKRDTVRPLDRIDAEAIRERFHLDEED
ncbi:MAG TPA: hypothetical protein VE075_02330 [Thermoanaerobaculia bacterium]|nr:hypothetical protein [Thermoanaerobaculia bacterium]